MAGLTLTIITQRAQSLNYGENVGNVSVLKKVTLGDGRQKTYVSDKALKYEIRRKGKEEKGWRLLDEKLKELVQKHTSKNGKKETFNEGGFAKELIKEYEEFDLFGGLFTKDLIKGLKESESGVKRTTVVKTSYAFSIAPFSGDVDFLNNIDAYNRYIKHMKDKTSERDQAILYPEQHASHYYYTVTVDLDRVGRWEGEDVIDNEEKAKRVKDLLDILFTLSRQIRARWENLSPIFVIGGIFSVKNPFFLDAIDAYEENGKLYLNVERLKEAKELVPQGEKVLCGVRAGYFINEEEIKKELGARSVKEVFEALKGEVDEYYGGS